MANETGHARSKFVGATLLVFGLVCLSLYLFLTFKRVAYQREANATIDDQASADRAIERPAEDVPAPAVKRLETGELIGRVEIPRLNIAAAVAEGDDDKTLEKAVGHLPDTALPWDLNGNVALAAHRDGLFRRLEHIKVNDDVRLVTPGGEYVYQVKRTHIVMPNDVWVIAPTPEPTITLITCYPFSYVGHAPKRFIVQAELVGRVAGSVVKGTVVQ